MAFTSLSDNTFQFVIGKNCCFLHENKKRILFAAKRCLIAIIKRERAPKFNFFTPKRPDLLNIEGKPLRGIFLLFTIRDTQHNQPGTSLRRVIFRRINEYTILHI